MTTLASSCRVRRISRRARHHDPLPADSASARPAGKPRSSAERRPARGFSPPRASDVCQFTPHQQNPETAALPAASAGGTRRSASKPRWLENKCAVRSASNNAELRQGQASAGPAEPSRLPTGKETGDSTVSRSTLPLGRCQAPRARRAPAAPHRLPDGGSRRWAAGVTQESTARQPSYRHGSHRHKKAIHSLPALSDALQESSVLGRVQELGGPAAPTDAGT